MLPFYRELLKSALAPPTGCVKLPIRGNGILAKKSCQLMNANTCQIGQWGEGITVLYLEGLGYKILSRNYHTSQGEIDIVALSPDKDLPCLVFVEVKTRSSSKFGYPEEAVSRAKWTRIMASIQHYLEQNPEGPSEWRVDVVAIVGHPKNEEPQIQHYENVVMPDERE